MPASSSFSSGCRSSIHSLLIPIWHAWLDFEHKSTSFVCLCHHIVEQDSHRRRVGVIDDRAASHIKIDSPQDGCAGNQQQHGSTDLSMLIHDAYTQRFGSQVWCQLCPLI